MTISKTTKMTRYFIYIILLTVFVSGCTSEEEVIENNNSEINFTAVDYTVVKAQTIEQILQVPGRTLPFEEVKIFSEINGRVKSINFEEGERVKKNEILVRIDTDILEAEKNQLQVDLRLAEKDFNRKKQLYEDEAGTLESVEKSESTLEGLKAQVALINVQINKGTIRAPFSGRIGLRQISEGAYITTSDLITTLAQTEKLKVSFSIAQRYASMVKMGQEISLKPPSDSLNVSAKKATVYAADPTIDQETQMYNIRAKMDKNSSLVPGGFVSILYNLGEVKNSIQVPTQAIAPVVDGQIVWKFNNGKAEKVKVNVGVRTSDKIQIFGDVTDGDTIVMTGLLGMQDGKNITPKKEIK
jgi:membrane fusion protein (multidrug efflux system)